MQFYQRFCLILVDNLTLCGVETVSELLCIVAAITNGIRKCNAKNRVSIALSTANPPPPPPHTH
jgi:hypothetical protein